MTAQRKRPQQRSPPRHTPGGWRGPWHGCTIAECQLPIPPRHTKYPKCKPLGTNTLHNTPEHVPVTTRPYNRHTFFVVALFFFVGGSSSPSSISFSRLGLGAPLRDLMTSTKLGAYSLLPPSSLQAS